MENKDAKAEIKDGYIRLTFLKQTGTLSLNEVSSGWKVAESINADKSMPVFLVTGKWTLIDKDAREFVMNELKSWPAVAILVYNLGQKLMGQVVIKILTKSGKVKLFDTEEEAHKWLLSLK